MKYSRTLGAFAFVMTGISLSGCAMPNGDEQPILCPANGCKEHSLSNLDTRALLKNASDIARGRGFRTTRVTSAGVLDSGQSRGFSYLLTPGRMQLVIALCDKQCSDLDVGVYQVDGTEIASDTAEDAIPIVEINPDKEVTVIVRVKMIRCDVAPCRYGVGIYRE